MQHKHEKNNLVKITTRDRHDMVRNDMSQNASCVKQTRGNMEQQGVGPVAAYIHIGQTQAGSMVPIILRYTSFRICKGNNKWAYGLDDIGGREL